MNQYQISCKARHYRHMFFVDEDYGYSNLLRLIEQNQKLWGGRYNPIIPTKKGIIADGYVDIIKHYDPDYIFYTKGVQVDLIKKLRLFNPCGYFNLEDTPHQDILGVDALYLLSRFDIKSNVLIPRDLYKLQSNLSDFYTINFGLTQVGILSDYQITKGYNQITVSEDNFNSINKIIHEQKPINLSHLSKRNILTSVLRTASDTIYNSFELIIAKDKSSVEDLLYFWNRQLYECHNVMFATLEDVLTLSDDIYFGAVLFDLSDNYRIDVVSFSLSKKEIEEVIKDKILKVAFQRQFVYKEIKRFPYSVLDANGGFFREASEQTLIQTISTENAILSIPKLSFTDKIDFFLQEWALDFSIKQTIPGPETYIEFPLTTDMKYFFRQAKGRVNIGRDISIFISNHSTNGDTLQIQIQSFHNLLKQLISAPIVQGELVQTKYHEIGFHDSSNKLNAFVKTFKGNLHMIDEYFRDKFWVDIFDRLCKSLKPAGDSITFGEILENCKAIIAEPSNDIRQLEEPNRNETNLTLGLKVNLQELCKYAVFLQGFKLKCPNCSSIYWYPIKAVDELITCFGCLEKFALPVEPDFAYKLNDLIKNNIYQSKTQRDGNLTVIRTLIYLGIRKHSSSFQYSPQINVFDNPRSSKPYTDIDIVATLNGKFIIGEAKHNSSEFKNDSNKSLNALIEIAKVVFPDKIMLSCYVDEYSRLENAGKYLKHYFQKLDYQPEIETIQLSSPSYFNLKGDHYFYY